MRFSKKWINFAAFSLQRVSCSSGSTAPQQSTHLPLVVACSCQPYWSHPAWHHPWRTAPHASPGGTQVLSVWHTNKHLYKKVSASQNTDQDLAIEAVGQWQPVVHFSEQFWHLSGVLCLHLTLKPIHLVHSLALVVACQQSIYLILCLSFMHSLYDVHKMNTKWEDVCP